MEKLNNGMKKIVKGMFALFMINLLIFGGASLIQSCQNEDDLQTNNSDFQNSLKSTFKSMKNIEVDNSTKLLAKNQETYKKIYLTNSYIGKK